MKTINMFVCVGLVLLLSFSFVLAEDDGAFERTTLWIGSHYVDFTDYSKKIGEYLCGEDEWIPELELTYFARSDNSIFRLDGHYHDEKDIFADARATKGDHFTLRGKYRSFIRQLGQDLLTNMEAREFFESTGNPGGKMLTHEILDPGADYDYKRQEILTEVELLLSRKNNIRFSSSHRSVLKNGEEQAIASNHCFSCHLTSEGAEVVQRSHHFEAGLDAELGGSDIGYRFGYRLFESNAPDPVAYYDPAKHPVHGGAGAEFSSRQLFDDTSVAYSTLPKTQKMSHKVRFKRDVGEGKFASSLGYSIAKNKFTDLSAEAYVGAANYTIGLNSRTRLVTKGAVTMLKADDPWIDLPDYRDGAADLNEADFDFTRYSGLDRWDLRFSAEVISRLSPRVVLHVLGGYNRIDRDDYPAWDEGTQTDQFIGQVKMRYRKGLRYTSLVKYRFEKTSDPFVSARGLFELPGYDILEPAVPTSPWIFYWQREDLRYQNITSVPTDKHVFEWRSTYRPSGRHSLNIGLKGKYDKNNDLDSLDVKHFSLQPNLNINYTPDVKWTLAAGYTYSFDKSKLPITVALFDG